MLGFSKLAMTFFTPILLVKLKLQIWKSFPLDRKLHCIKVKQKSLVHQ